MKHLVFLILLSLLFFTKLEKLSAQNQTDFGIWSGTSVSQKIIKKLSADFQGQVRLDGNAAYFKSLYFDFGLNYKFHDIFTLSLGYRYSIGDIRNTHRVYGDLNFVYSPPKSRTTFKIRLRGQYSTSSDLSRLPETVLRPRLFVNYNPKGKTFKKFNFYATGELFFTFMENFQDLSRYRVTAGATYDLSANTKINVRYIFQEGVNEVAPVQEHILSLGLIIELPKLKFKKKKKNKDKDKDGKKEGNKKDKKDKDKKKDDGKADDKADDLDKDKN